MEKKKKMSRKARWFLAIVLSIIVFAIVAFIQKRDRDKDAWPSPLDVGECVGGTPAGLDLITYEEIKDIVPPNDSPTPQVTESYRHFLIYGYSKEKVAPHYLKRAEELKPVHNKLLSLLDENQGFDSTKYGAVPFADTISLLVEYQLLQNIAAAEMLASHSITNYQEASIEYWVKPLRYMHTSLRGTGILGRGVAAEIARTFASEICMGSEAHPFTYDQVKGVNAEVRKYLTSPDSLEQAIRDDHISFVNAAAAVYDQIDNDAPPSEIYGGKPIGGMTKVYIGWLGGTREVTIKNIDSVFSYLIVNSRNPYTPDSILEGLPKWCYGIESGPYTVDPIGETIVSAYLTQARTIVAINCHYETELRVAMIGFALNAYKHVNGKYPEDLSVLIDEGLILKEDLVDPFSINRASELKYKSENNGAAWRIYSVGVDQADNGGVLPIQNANSENFAEIERTDLVYQSGERARRIKSASQQ